MKIKVIPPQPAPPPSPAIQIELTLDQAGELRAVLGAVLRLLTISPPTRELLKGLARIVPFNEAVYDASIDTMQGG